MNDLQQLGQILLQSIFAQNLVFIRFLALCSFVGLTADFNSAVGMSWAVTFVTVLASAVSYVVYHFLLVPFNLEYLQTITFILTIAVFVQLVEIYLKKAIPSLHRMMGIYLPLIASNCMILAVALLNVTEKYNLLEATVFSLGASIGYALALIIMAGIRERLRYAKVPELMKGYPLIFIASAFIAIAFMGLQGLGR
jgi:electron transport complex protein RnfA